MRKRITLATNNDITIEKGFERFLLEKKSQSVEDKTIKNYKDTFKMFTDYKGGNALCSHITREDIQGFVDFKNAGNPQLSENSINTYLRNLKTVLYFFMNEGLMDGFDIKVGASKPTNKMPYTSEEIMKLLKKPNIKESSFSDYRNWCMVNFLLGTGVRRRTLANIKIKDVDFENNQIYLAKMKNKKAKYIPLSSALKKVLQEYIFHRQGTPEDYLFCTQYGNQMALEGVKSAIQRFNEARGVSKTSVHLFRHTFARDWILSGGSIEKLQEILGHADLEMTRKYIKLFIADLKEDFEFHSSLDLHYTSTNKIRMKNK